jgi:hypothetical protein
MRIRSKSHFGCALPGVLRLVLPETRDNLSLLKNPPFFEPRRKFQFTEDAKTAIFSRVCPLGRDRRSHGCDVFGFVNPYTSPSVIVQIKNPYTFSELKNRRF